MIQKIVCFILVVFAASCSNSPASVQPAQKNEIIVDVRTIDEWEHDGHAPCSINIPLDQLANRMDELREYDKVILVCHSGNRAGMAEKILKREGFTNTENRGSWENITCP